MVCPWVKLLWLVIMVILPNGYISNTEVWHSASRAVIEKAWGGRDCLTTADRIQASAMAGGFSGMIGGLIRELNHPLKCLLTC